MTHLYVRDAIDAASGNPNRRLTAGARHARYLERADVATRSEVSV
jgi:hypothetical protein